MGVAKEQIVKRDLGFGCLGNGMLVYDRLHEKHGDFEKIAHISAERVVTYYVELSPEDTARIEKEARESDPGISYTQQDQKVFKTRPVPQEQADQEEDEEYSFGPR